MIYNLSDNFSLISHYLGEIRDQSRQSQRVLFRQNINRVSSCLAYEVSKSLKSKICEIQTPLAIAKQQLLDSAPVIGTVLRAGLIMHQAFLDMFDGADSAFIASYRKHKADGSFDIETGYVTCPDLTGRTLILTDTMLATGHSTVSALERLRQYGKPERTIIAAVIGARDGVEFVQKHHPEADLFLAVIDPGLNAEKYIVPGLGDAGDLSFGEKLQR